MDAEERYRANCALLIDELDQDLADACRSDQMLDLVNAHRIQSLRNQERMIDLLNYLTERAP